MAAEGQQPAPAPSDAAPPPLRMGTTVELFGLADEGLNGVCGTIMADTASVSERTGQLRWAIRVPGRGNLVSIKPGNLRAVVDDAGQSAPPVVVGHVRKLQMVFGKFANPTRELYGRLSTNHAIQAAYDDSVPLIVGPVLAVIATIVTISIHGVPFQTQDGNSMEMPAENANMLMQALGVSRKLLRDGQYYRVITSMFCHAGWFHVFCNLRAAAQYGPMLERCYGKARFIVVLMVAGLGGVCLSTLPIRPSVLSVGASGVVFGMQAAFYLLWFQSRAVESSESGKRSLLCFGIYLLTEAILAAHEVIDGRRDAEDQAEWVQFALVIVSALIQAKIKDGESFALNSALLQGLFLQIMVVSNIDHMAHVGGAIGGAVCAFGVLPKFWWQPQLAAPWVLRSTKSLAPTPSGGTRTEGQWRSMSEASWVALCFAVVVGILRM
jgi:membrane associated rhomboid family serine protease